MSAENPSRLKGPDDSEVMPESGDVPEAGIERRLHQESGLWEKMGPKAKRYGRILLMVSALAAGGGLAHEEYQQFKQRDAQEQKLVEQKKQEVFHGTAFVREVKHLPKRDVIDPDPKYKYNVDVRMYWLDTAEPHPELWIAVVDLQGTKVEVPVSASEAKSLEIGQKITVTYKKTFGDSDYRSIGLGDGRIRPRSIFMANPSEAPPNTSDTDTPKSK